jgi:hypothetical protein
MGLFNMIWAKLVKLEGLRARLTNPNGRSLHNKLCCPSYLFFCTCLFLLFNKCRFRLKLHNLQIIGTLMNALKRGRQVGSRANATRDENDPYTCCCMFLQISFGFLALLDLNSSNWWNDLDLSGHLVWESRNLTWARGVQFDLLCYEI